MDALNYNEKKLQKGKAACIAANGYLLPPEKMNFYQKLAGFKNLNKRNDRAVTKTLHVSLNFDPSEKLPDERLNAIAATYMQKIGFGEQPYLVYRHDDAGHPHVHIVSTTIREDGSRINTHNIGRNQSEKARKEIEREYNLIRAGNQLKQNVEKIKPVDIKKVQYGKSETKRGITNILAAIFNHYNYTSLPEFNAALRQYNIMADRGEEGGVMFNKRGLLYRIITDEGIPVGVPVKASAIYFKPALENLEKNFERNKESREPLKQKLRATLEEALLERPGSILQLKEILAKKQVFTLLRKNAEGRLYGITFVDNRHKSVFNGSDVGRQYSIGNLQHVLAKNTSPPKQTIGQPVTDDSSHVVRDKLIQKRVPKVEMPGGKTVNLLEQLMSPKQSFEMVPFQLVKKKKKKRKKNTNDL